MTRARKAMIDFQQELCGEKTNHEDRQENEFGWVCNKCDYFQPDSDE